MDFLAPKKRSELMSKIGSKDSKSEIRVRKYLHLNGFRFRKNVSYLPGTPDIVLPKYKAIIFIHGCYWHGHFGCSKSRLPESNVDFWRKKILSNIDRDNKVLIELEKLNWRVAIVWECYLKNKTVFEQAMTALTEWIVSQDVVSFSFEQN